MSESLKVTALNGVAADSSGNTAAQATPKGGSGRLSNFQILYTSPTQTTADNDPDSFTYTVSDGNGGTATATVNLTIDPQNDAPVAVDNVFNLAEDLALTLNPAQLLGNDSDIDGDALTYAIVGSSYSTRPTIDNQTGLVKFSPVANWSGTEVVRFKATDDGPGNKDVSDCQRDRCRGGTNGLGDVDGVGRSGPCNDLGTRGYQGSGRKVLAWSQSRLVPTCQKQAGSTDVPVSAVGGSTNG